MHCLVSEAKSQIKIFYGSNAQALSFFIFTRFSVTTMATLEKRMCSCMAAALRRLSGSLALQLTL